MITRHSLMRAACPVAFCLTMLMFCDLVAAQQKTGKRNAGQATLYETLGDIKAFSKRLDNAEDDVERIDAIVDLGALYLRVVGDPRFFRSEVLQGNRGRIAAKLQKARKLIEKAKRQAAKERGSSASRYVTEASGDVTLRGLESAVIDKQWLMITHAVGGASPSMYYSSGMHGTSGHFYRGRGGGLPDDNGDELLDLIRTIIHPDFWQINGGSGRAYYYQPLRILVVRATQRVHEDMQSLLERLRGQL